MTYKPKVLVGVVTWDRKDYCKEEFMKRIMNLTDDTYGVHIIDTTRFKGNSRDRTTNGYNKLRKYFLDLDYDYLMIIESDIIPPKYIIEALMIHDKDVCSAVYMIGRKNDRHPCIFKKGLIKRKVGNRYLKLLQHYKASDLDGDLWKVEGMSGLGCHLIKRKVLEKISFHHGDTYHCDTCFHNDLHKEGFEDYVDTGILCKHYGNATEWMRIQHEHDF